MAVVVSGFLGGGQRLLVAPRLGETDGESVQRPGEEVQVGVGVGLGQSPVDRDGLLGGSQRLLVSTEIRQRELECVQRDREDVTASWAGASACSWRPQSLLMQARLWSDVARPGRWVSAAVPANRR